MTTSDLRVRRAVSEDAARVSVFARAVFERTFGPDNTPEDMAAYASVAFSEEAQGREIADPSRTLLIGESDGAIVAYALLKVGATDPSVSGESPVEIERFYVDHAWHGRGVAGRFMRAAIDTARALGGRTLWLGVWERNARAIRFYEKFGFLDVGSHPFVLGTDLQTDRVMARSLDTVPADA